MAKRRGKRRRDRDRQRFVQEEFFHWNDAPQIRCRRTRRGDLKFVVFDCSRVCLVGREHAAHWLRTAFPDLKLDHETAYSTLWDDVPKP